MTVGGLVSVVIPVFNGESFILDAVRSVLAQSYEHLELVVVDDGSTDRSPQLIREVNDDRLRHLRQPNRGLAAACNKGISASSGDVISFLDADDEWLPEKLERQLVSLEAGVFVYSDILYWDADSGEDIGGYDVCDRLPYDRSRFSGSILATLLAQSCVHPSTMMLLRDDLSRVGSFDESLRHCEDWDFVLRAAQHLSFERIESQLVRVRRHAGSHSTNDRAMRLGGRRVLDDARRRLIQDNAMSGSNEGSLGLGYFVSRNIRPAVRHLGRAILRNPGGGWLRWFLAALAWRPLNFLRGRP